MDDRKDTQKPANDDFDDRIDRLTSKNEKKPSTMRLTEKNMGVGFKIATELLAALVVGVGMGWLLDDWLGTKPWMLILFFFLGSAAGVLNVYKTVLNKKKK